MSLAPLSVRFETAASNSRTCWVERRGALLQLMTEGGQLGQGECSPLPDYSADQLTDCLDALANYPWAQLQRSILSTPSPSGLREALDVLPSAVPAARFALETALLDLVSTQQPAWSLLGGRRPASGRALPRCQLLSGASPAQRLDEAIAARDAGVSVVKFKLGRRAFEQELVELAKFRSELGEELGIRLDVNQGWTAAEAAHNLAALAPLAVELVEEPVPFAQLSRLSSAPVPIALDESLQDEQALALLPGLAARGLVSALVLKPTVLGGAARCLELAERAVSLGLGVSVSHCLDGSIAFAASGRLAALLDEPMPCGLVPHPGLALAIAGPSERLWSVS